MLRHATTRDVQVIQKILEHYARQEILLPRSLSDLYDNVRDFVVYQEGDKVIATSALHVCWDDLGEIRSLAVLPDYTKRGIGAELVAHCEAEARQLGLRQVFTLTYQERFFANLGYQKVDKATLPHKVWSDCLKCVKFPNCDEIAMSKTLVDTHEAMPS
ncbi:MAG: N-acetyltransferase [Deltaproteobacteria bacterium]|nr:N-acetyltransferase [Candidatus Anaeroferrophillus wilburensis]MBN2889668.1 N-acetyltransferase [Deltaproteobacteria bacterium]